MEGALKDISQAVVSCKKPAHKLGDQEQKNVLERDLVQFLHLGKESQKEIQMQLGSSQERLSYMRGWRLLAHPNID